MPRFQKAPKVPDIQLSPWHQKMRETVNHHLNLDHQRSVDAASAASRAKELRWQQRKARAAAARAAAGDDRYESDEDDDDGKRVASVRAASLLPMAPPPQGEQRQSLAWSHRDAS